MDKLSLVSEQKAEPEAGYGDLVVSDQCKERRNVHISKVIYVCCRNTKGVASDL